MDLTALTGRPILFGLVVIGASFIFEDPTTIAVATLISDGKITFSLGFFPLMWGIIIGDLGLYYLGVGIRKGFRRTKLVPVIPSIMTIVVARFVPGMRTITFTSAGLKEFPIGKFIIISFPSTIIWTLLLLEATDQVLALLRYFPPWINIIIGLIVFISLQLFERRIRRHFQEL